MKNLSQMLILLIIPWMLAGCGISKDIRKSAESASVKLESVAKEVDSLTTQFEKLKGVDEYSSFLVVYSEREGWTDNFSKARGKLDEARSLLVNVSTLLKKNDPKTGEEVQRQVKRVDALRQEALELAKTPNNRINFLREVREKAPGMVETARGQMKQSRDLLASVQEFVSGQQSKYPNREGDIAAKFAPTQALLVEAEKAMVTIEANFGRHLESKVENGGCDYAVLGDNVELVAKNSSQITVNEQALREVLGQLDRSYSKTLVDMKVDYYIQVGRTSWDDYSDWNTDQDYIYPERLVTPEAHEYFATLGDNAELASQGIGFDSQDTVKPLISESYWGMLSINPGESWPSNHDEAQYWLAEDQAKYYHKYLLVENEKERETDWEEVSEEIFEEHEEDLGMDIVAKPIGMFEDEALNQAMPAGMAFVGNPNYGQWKQDPQTGDSFWEFYGKWHFYSSLFGGTGPGYYRSEWSTWDRDYRQSRQGYYGSQGEGYGTGSERTQKRFANAHAYSGGGFAKRGATGSVRNAAGVRGGGPGGGGK